MVPSRHIPSRTRIRLAPNRVRSSRDAGMEVRTVTTGAEQGAGRAPIRVVIVDDHRTLAELLALSLRHEPDLDLVGHAATGVEGVRLVRACRPDAVLMDFSLPDQDGI